LSWLLSFNNISFEKSLTISILTLTNTVNSNNFSITNFDFYELNFASKSFLMLFMVIGRVELLSFLILLKRFFLKN
jgi:trk system potassium uptake protein TrkH